jgi:hypothetical protein
METAGWFAISRLEPFLDMSHNERPYTHAQLKRYDKEIGRDAIPKTARESALLALPHIVPNAPFPRRLALSGVDEAELAAAWKKWITENRETLMRLEPTGAGLHVTNSICRALGAKRRKPSKN